MIQLRSVSKEFADGNKVLRNINLTINNGEFVFLVGSSGAGKSTIIKLLLKEMEPTTGTIIVGDKDITKYKRREIPFHRRNIGVVFQDFRLLQEKTVYENVAFAMEVIEAPPKEIRRQVPIILSMVGLSKKAGLYPQQLSGGSSRECPWPGQWSTVLQYLLPMSHGNLDPDMSWDIMKTLE